MRLPVFAALLGAFSSFSPVIAFDEVGIIKLASFDNVTSTGKNCVPKAYDPAVIPDRYFALVRTGETAVVAAYVGVFNGTSLTAAVNDRNMNLTLTHDGNDSIRVSVQQEDGVCEYLTKVVAGSVLNITNTTSPITEAGVLTVTDMKNVTNLATCENTAEDVNGTYAFVRTETLTVMGGFWGVKHEGNNTLLKRQAPSQAGYTVTATDGNVTIHTDGGKNTTVRDAGGCSFGAAVVSGSVMGVLAPNSTAGIPVSLRGSKAVCRQTCGPRVCRTVCRDYWRS